MRLWSAQDLRSLLWVIVSLAGLWLGPIEVFAAVSNACVRDCSGMQEPTCDERISTKPDGCGGPPCVWEKNNYCQVPHYPACEETVEGTRVCGEDCKWKNDESCTNPQPHNDWRIYGVALPGDPVYGLWYQDPNTGEHVPLYPDPKTRDLLGLAAKGNIVIGDYLSPDFQTQVLPLLDSSSPGAKVQPYAIDPTDADLGYFSYAQDGLEMFDGDYTQVDAAGLGRKLDGSPRKFYESTLPDDRFDAFMAPFYPQYGQTRSVGKIDAVLFTNHAIVGLTKDLRVNGAIIARDDALSVQNLTLNHDIRLLDKNPLTDRLALPMALQRPTLRRWEECAPAGCP